MKEPPTSRPRGGRGRAEAPFGASPLTCQATPKTRQRIFGLSHLFLGRPSPRPRRGVRPFMECETAAGSSGDPLRKAFEPRGISWTPSGKAQVGSRNLWTQARNRMRRPRSPARHLGNAKRARGIPGAQHRIPGGVQDLLRAIGEMQSGLEESLDPTMESPGGVQDFLRAVWEIQNGLEEFLEPSAESPVASKISSAPFGKCKMGSRKSWTPAQKCMRRPGIPRTQPANPSSGQGFAVRGFVNPKWP